LIIFAFSRDKIHEFFYSMCFALLQHFGSRADVETATIAELEKVEGVSQKTARAIYEYFHG
jgi:ERCC4-type nuclease